MPFTPYHLGPASLTGFSLFKILDLPTLLVGSVIIDIEPFMVMTFKLDYPLHGYCHTFLIGTIIALLVATTMFQMRGIAKKVMSIVKLQQESSWWNILSAALLGVWIHVGFDSLLYTDIRPFFPLNINPLYDLLSDKTIYIFCGISLFAGIFIHLTTVLYNLSKMKD